MVVTIMGLVVVALVAAIAFRYLKMRSLEDQIVVDYTGLLIPLWAIMGPYDDAESSAYSMGLCLFTIASKGDEKTIRYSKDQIIEMMIRHRVAFDNSPEEWNNLLIDSEPLANEMHYNLAKEINSIVKAKFREEYDL